MKKFIFLILLAVIITSCKSYETTNKSYDSSKDIVILYSFITPDIGNNKDDIYSRIKDAKESMLKETPNVTLVEAGNNLFLDKMNDTGYDYACFGVNVINNSLDSIYENTKKAKYKYLLCSASYSGQIKDVFKKTTPYEVVNYDGIKIGYVGVLSPLILEKQLLYFTDGSEKSINLYNETEEVFYDTVQCSIDKAKSKGADYIILLSHFDEDPNYSPYTLEELVANLSNVDIVLNENLFFTNKEYVLKDKNNKETLIISNDNKSSRFGKVTIKNGIYENEIIEEFDE